MGERIHGVERAFVWTGGALFVASLALTVWYFGVVWADAGPFAGWDAVAFDFVVFSVFALHHSLFARAWVKTKLTAIVPERLLRSVYVWVASLLLIAVLLAWRDVSGVLYRASGPLRFVHAGIQLFGIALIAGAVRAIDGLDLAGIRQAARSDDLQTSGPYHLVRHPLYLGWVLIVFGAATITGDRLAFAVISTAYLFVAVPWEERGLDQVFGNKYAEYKRKVRWRILPYVY